MSENKVVLGTLMRSGGELFLERDGKVQMLRIDRHTGRLTPMSMKALGLRYPNPGRITYGKAPLVYDKDYALTDLVLSTRLRNVLETNLFETVGQILAYGKREIGRLPGMGEKSFVELLEELRRIRIRVDLWD